MPRDVVCHASNRRRRCGHVQAVCVYAHVNAMLQCISTVCWRFNYVVKHRICDHSFARVPRYVEVCNV